VTAPSSFGISRDMQQAAQDAGANALQERSAADSMALPVHDQSAYICTMVFVLKVTIINEVLILPRDMSARSQDCCGSDRC
jgi:hypothetical protein